MSLLQAKTLFWFHHTDCEYCRAAEPVLDQWKSAHPDVLVIKLNTAYQDWEKYGYKPKKTPAYLYVLGMQPMGKIEGALMKPKHIDDFIHAVGK